MSDESKQLTIQEIDIALALGDETGVWRAAEALGEYAKTDPDAIWPLVVKHASGANPEVRSAIATCVLEHVLEHHFDRYFPLVEAIVRSGNRCFAEAFKTCWKFGHAEEPDRAKRWDELLTQIRALESKLG